MKKRNNANKFSFYSYQGLPIAAVALGLLLVFLLVTINLTQNDVQEENNVQGVIIRTQPVNDSSLIDSVLRDIDSLLKSNDNLNSSDLSDLQ